MFVKKTIQIQNPQGLHARPASLFVQIANKYESDITVKKDDEVVNGKSIMGLLVLGANQGSIIEVEISGEDALEMMKELESFLSRVSEDDPSAHEKDAK